LKGQRAAITGKTGAGAGKAHLLIRIPTSLDHFPANIPNIYLYYNANNN
jgi:hypothetical protein